MAKDDYFVMVCKLLVYLYRRLKGRTKKDPEEYLLPLSKDFPATEGYFYYLLEKTQEAGMIEGVELTREWSGDIICADVSGIQILPAGIEYLQENRLMRRIARTVPLAAQIADLFR